MLYIKSFSRTALRLTVFREEAMRLHSDVTIEELGLEELYGLHGKIDDDGNGSRVIVYEGWYD
jgi:hypothetical protein